MTIRYGNDLALTEINRQIKALAGSIDACLRDGHLDSMFIQARMMHTKLDKLMARLNEIKPLPPLPDGYK